MDPILQVLLSWQFVLFGLAIATVVYVFRTIVEYFASLCKANLSASQLWNNLILPLFPIAIGILAALVLKKFPYPGFVPNAAGVIVRGDRIIFGLVTGLLSTLMYRVVKSLLYQKMVGIAQGFQTPNYQPVMYQPAQPVVQEQIPANQMPLRGQI